MNYSQFITPSPTARFSNAWFRSITLLQVACSELYPTVASRGSLHQGSIKWTTSGEAELAPGEAIPNPLDISLIIHGMAAAFEKQFTAVEFSFAFESMTHTVCYSFSKVCSLRHIIFASQVNKFILSTMKLELARNAGNYRKHWFEVKALVAHISGGLYLPLDSTTYERFMQCRFLEPIPGFLYAIDRPLYKLGTLIDEVWVDEDVLNVLLELEYFERHADAVQTGNRSLELPPCHLLLPTDFLGDVTAFQHYAEYQACRRLRARLDSTPIFSVNCAQFDGNHFTALTYNVGSGKFEYGDSLHQSFNPELVPRVRLAISTQQVPLPTAVTYGQINRQGELHGGAGSCAIAALNFMQRSVKYGTEMWSGPQAARFRDVALIRLIRYVVIAREHAGAPSDWVVPASPEVGALLGEGVPTHGGALDHGYVDFNLYRPLVSTFHCLNLCRAITYKHD